MKKILLLSIIVTFIISGLIIKPSVSDASWWNPISWFTKTSTSKDIPTVKTGVDVQGNKVKLQGVNTESQTYNDEWSFSFDYPKGWTYTSTTTPTVNDHTYKIIKIVPNADAESYLKLPLKSMLIKSNDFNSEVIYVVEGRIPLSRYVPVEITDEGVFRSSMNSMSYNLNIKDFKDMVVYDKGLFKKPLTGFYYNSKTNSHGELIANLSAEDSVNMYSSTIYYIGKDGKFNQAISKLITDSFKYDVNKLKPKSNYNLSITSKPISYTMVASSTSSTTDPAAMVGLRSAVTTAEIYYNKKSTYSGFCLNDADFIKIKKELSPRTVSCKDSPNAVAVSASLNTGGYWCYDSTGNQMKTTKLNTTTSCSK
jgi:hypothetical protein